MTDPTNGGNDETGSHAHGNLRLGCGLSFLLAVVGTVIGGFLGAQWYIQFGPPWAQYGYEFEGLMETLIGAGLGLVLGGVVGFLTGWRINRDPRRD